MTSTEPFQMTFWNTDYASASEFVDQINSAVADGSVVRIAGDEVFTRWGSPASVWGTGSVSIKVKARAKYSNGTFDQWVKVGQSVSVEVWVA